MVHLKGSMEPVPTVLLHSVFFPTTYPTKDDPQLGLVRSQQDVLTNLAAGFKQFLGIVTLKRSCHLAETRTSAGGNDYNQSLSELRVQRVKEFLVSQGIAAPRRSIPLRTATRNRWTKPRLATCRLAILTSPPEKRAH